MRGKVDEVHEMKDNVRITPAYAGKRASVSLKEEVLRDHPRLCGEKLPRFCLSPRSGGITPAYAGKRSFPCTV